MTTNPHALLFVYNADSGLFNTLADMGHKLFSPQTYACALCALTHGYFTEREAWRRFVDRLPCRCEFLHRDEFRRRFPSDQTTLPAVFAINGERPAVLADASRIGACADLHALQHLIEALCAEMRENAT